MPSGSAPEMSRSGETITAIRPAPASFAAAIGHETSARPQTGCRTLGMAESIRVPCPAAMIRTVGALTGAIVLAGGWRGQAGLTKRNPAARISSSRSLTYARTHLRIALSLTPYLRPTAQ